MPRVADGRNDKEPTFSANRAPTDSPTFAHSRSENGRGSPAKGELLELLRREIAQGAISAATP